MRLYAWLLVPLASACSSPGGLPPLCACDPRVDPPPTDVGNAPLVGGFLYQPGQVLDFGLELDPDARAALAADGRTSVPATFTWNDERYPVSVHLKGNVSYRGLDAKPSWKVDFHDEDPEADFHGVRRLTLNNMVQDGSMLAESGAYYFYGAMGLVAPRHGYARLTVDGEPYGLYGIVETPDEQFLDRFASDEGNLYAGGYGGDVSKGNAENFELDEQGDVVEPYTDLEQLCDAMDGPAADWWDRLGRYFDRDALLGLWAVEIVSGQGDGYVGWGNNFLLYDDIAADEWVMIPWGTDQAFRKDMRLDAPDDWRGKLVVACLADRTCTNALRTRVSDALDVWQAADVPGWLRSQAAAIADDCQADVRTEIPCKWTRDQVLDFADARRDQLR